MVPVKLQSCAYKLIMLKMERLKSKRKLMHEQLPTKLTHWTNPVASSSYRWANNVVRIIEKVAVIV